MFRFYLISSAVILQLIGSGNGLYCYNCIYIETELPPGINSSIPSDISCQSRESLKNKDNFIVDCEDIRYDETLLPVPGMTQLNQAGILGLETSLVNTEPGSDENVVTFTCAKFVFNGTFNQHYKSLPFRSTIRTCIPRLSSKPFQEVCNNGTLVDVVNARHEFEVKTALEKYRAILVNSTYTVACTCNDGTCNGSPFSVTRIPFFATVLLSILLILQ